MKNSNTIALGEVSPTGGLATNEPDRIELTGEMSLTAQVTIRHGDIIIYNPATAQILRIERDGAVVWQNEK